MTTPRNQLRKSMTLSKATMLSARKRQRTTKLPRKETNQVERQNRTILPTRLMMQNLAVELMTRLMMQSPVLLTMTMTTMTRPKERHRLMITKKTKRRARRRLMITKKTKRRAPRNKCRRTIRTSQQRNRTMAASREKHSRVATSKHPKHPKPVTTRSMSTIFTMMITEAAALEFLPWAS
jgi:hypothetical protein